MKLIPTTTQPVTITLYQGIPFDNNYTEHPLMSPQFKYRDYTNETAQVISGDKESFINMKETNNEFVYPRTSKTGTFNFAFGNGLVTSVVMELTDNEINSNYMKVTSGNDNYYYFITGITQKNEVTYQLNLELDVFMTYSEEFLTNITSKPVMVERKHCRRLQRTSTGYILPKRNYINKVCYNQESLFNGIKPNILSGFNEMSFKDLLQLIHEEDEDYYEDYFSGNYWAYILMTVSGSLYYKENDIQYPYVVEFLPLFEIEFRFRQSGIPTGALSFNGATEFGHYMGNPNVLKIIISPFPPFSIKSNIKVTEDTTYPNHKRYIYTIDRYNADIQSSYYSVSFYTGSNDDGSHINLFVPIITQIPDDRYRTLNLMSGFGGRYNYSEIENYFKYTDPLSINITKSRDTNEFKLQLSPFKELKMSSFYGTEVHIPTNLLINGGSIETNNTLKPYTIASTNGEVNSYYNGVNIDGVNEDSSVVAKRGSSNSVNYNFPTSIDAMQVYNLTAKNQYETAKTNATLSNGFKMISSVGTAGLVRSDKSMAGMVTGLGSGIIGEIQNIERYNAKLADLESTPDKYSFGGSSLPYDVALSKGSGVVGGRHSLLPYLITYTCDQTRYDMASEFLYNYGYEYNKECYIFNTNPINIESDDVFVRRLFNYVKIREDITTKLVGNNLPLIVAKKMNEVLNAGIKFWNFFSMDLTSGSVVHTILRDYFQKTKYCNAELNSGNLN